MHINFRQHQILRGSAAALVAVLLLPALKAQDPTPSLQIQVDKPLHKVSWQRLRVNRSYCEGSPSGKLANRDMR